MNKNDDIKKEEELEEPVDNTSNGVAEDEVDQEDLCVQKLEEAENKYKRALADYQNLEKRVIEDRREWIRSGNKDLIQRILPILDTLLLASKHEKNKTLDISIAQFLDILKSEGLTKIETVGKSFDANLMECVTIIEGPDGKVIEEVRLGYMLNDRLLRAAQVIVGGKKEK